MDNDITKLFDILTSGIGFLTNPTKLSNIFASLMHSKPTSFTINSYIEYLENVFITRAAKKHSFNCKDDSPLN